MAGIAGGRLLRLREQDLLVTDEQRPECIELTDDLAQLIDVDGGGSARKLHDRLVERHLSIERRRDVQDAVAPDHRRLDHVADVELDDQRNDARMRKIDARDLVAGLAEDFAVHEFDGFQMRLDRGEGFRRERKQHRSGTVPRRVSCRFGGSAVASLSH